MPGLVTWVAVTVGGWDGLLIDVTLLPVWNQHIILTGQLGNVMQESARAALSHIRSRAEALGISPEFLAKHDLHIHVPAGFFFSSRRRHTRWNCDWSSDVCSSD